MLLTELGGFLQTALLGTMGTDLFGGLIPKTPDDLIAITQPYPGNSVLAMAKTLDHVEEPFTVTVRNTDADAGYTKAWAVFNALNNFTGTISSVRYLLILGRGIPFDLGPDENERFRWSCDYWAHKDAS